VLPDFLVIGAMRAGTSSLYRYLGMHPSIVPSLRKETRYFSDKYARGEHWYRCHFPTGWVIRLRELVQGSRILAFEATPDYLFHPYAADRAAGLIPNARLIVLLRDPVHRAVSHYEHMVRLGYETRSFEEALAEEPRMLERERARLAQDPGYDSHQLRRYSYFAKGAYADQLASWLERFARDQMLIIKSQDFFEEPQVTYRRILEFLNVPPWQPRIFRNYSHWGTKPTVAVAPRVDTPTRQGLARRYVPYNSRLYDLLGRDFGWSDNNVSFSRSAMEPRRNG
jgi:hypothetical protein